MYNTLTDQQTARVYPRTQPVAKERVSVRRLRAGAHLFHEGDPAKRIYRVTSGALRLTRCFEDGRRQVVAFGFPGDVVGFPMDGLYRTDCQALTPVELRPYLLTTTVPEESGLPPAFANEALREIAAMQDHFLVLARKTATGRVASFLSVLADRIGLPIGHYTQIDLPMCRADVADFLGLTTETVSRSFSQLRKSGVIALDGIYSVIVLRPDALQAIADGEDT